MKIGVSGASGQLGRAVVAELVRRGAGHRVAGISRTPQGVQSPAEGRYGDFDEPQTLVSAFEGVDRLLLIPSADLAPGVRGRQLKGAIDAAVEAGVKHLFLVSATGTRAAAAPALGESYWTAEQHLVRRAPVWTILRMNYYAEAMAQEIRMSLGMGVLTGLGDERVAYVSREDLAAAAAGALLGAGHAGAIYNATGPAAVSGAERGAIASEVLGRPLDYAVITEGQLRAGLSQAGAGGGRRGHGRDQDQLRPGRLRHPHGRCRAAVGACAEVAARRPRRDVVMEGRRTMARKSAYWAYWISTAVLCLLYLASTAMYLTTGEKVRQALVSLGYPAYLREVLIVVKVLGVSAILSRRSVALSDLAYAGMFFHLLLALLAHVSAGDGGFAPAVVGLLALLVSFFTQNAARTKKSPHASTGSFQSE